MMKFMLQNKTLLISGIGFSKEQLLQLKIKDHVALVGHSALLEIYKACIISKMENL